MSNERKVSTLDDLVVSEILSMSEEELLELVTPQEIDASRSRLAAATLQAAQIRLQRARAAVAADRARPARQPSDAQRASLGAVRRRDPSFDRKLTMAARNAGADARADEASIEEDLAELEGWVAEEKNKP